MDVGPYKKITKQDFNKILLITGNIAQIKKHPTSKAHYILIMETPLRDEDYQIVAELAHHYSMNELFGKQAVFIGNYPAKKIEGVESQGELLVAHINDKPVLIRPDKKVNPGTQIHSLNGNNK